MLTANALNKKVVRVATKNNSHEYENFLTLNHEERYIERMYKNKKAAMLTPSGVLLKTSANMPKMNADTILNASGR